MAKQTLAVRIATGAQQQVFRNNNGTFIAFGNAFTPNGGMQADGATVGKSNYAIQFGADFYCVENPTGLLQTVGVRKFNPSTGNWDQETLPSHQPDGNTAYAGLFIGRGPTGVPRLVLPFQEIGNNARAIYLEPGGSWTLGSVGPATGQPASRWSACVDKFRNQLILFIARGAAIYDIATDSWTWDPFVGTGNTYLAPAGCRAQGRYFCAVPFSSANEYWDLYELISGVFVQVIDGSLSSPTLPQEGNPNLNLLTQNGEMFYDGVADKLILMTWVDQGANQGLQIHTIDPATLAIVDVTSTVAPGALAYPGGPEESSDVHMIVQVDNETDPTSQSATVWISFANGTYEGFAYTMGAATQMTSIGSGGDRGIALSRMTQGGGEYIYEGSDTLNPALNIEEIQARVPIPGGTRVFVRGYTFDETGGSPTTPDETVGLYFNVGDDAGPSQLASLTAVAKVSGPGTAPTLNADKMEDMSMDGVSIYSMDWDAVLAGQVSNGENHQAMPRIEL